MCVTCCRLESDGRGCFLGQELGIVQELVRSVKLEHGLRIKRELDQYKACTTDRRPECDHSLDSSCRLRMCELASVKGRGQMHRAKQICTPDSRTAVASHTHTSLASPSRGHFSQMINLFSSFFDQKLKTKSAAGQDRPKALFLEGPHRDQARSQPQTQHGGGGRGELFSSFFWE